MAPFLIAIGGVVFLWGGVFIALSPPSPFTQKMADGLVLSASQMFPLIPGLRESRQEALKALYGSGIPWEITLLNFLQSTMALMLLFLLGLALRNRFRL